MIENLDFLFKRMKASRPVLLLGAGFSYGATNANNTPLLLGKKLSQELHKYFLISYFKSLPEKTRVAIYLDNAAYHYKKLIELKNSCPLNIEKLVIISEDTIENHIGKEYLLLDDFGSIPCFITAS